MTTHTFHALGFVENIPLRDLAAAYPDARRTAHELWYSTPSGGRVFVYPFGVMAFQNVGEEERATHVTRLRAAPAACMTRMRSMTSSCTSCRARKPTCAMASSTWIT